MKEITLVTAQYLLTYQVTDILSAHLSYIKSFISINFIIKARVTKDLTVEQQILHFQIQKNEDI